MKKIYLVVFLLFWFSFGFSQNPEQKKIDSLLLSIKKSKTDTLKCINYNEISSLYLYMDIRKGIEYANKGLTLSKKINWPKGVGISFLSIGKHQISDGKYSEALKNLKTAERIFIELNNQLELGSTYNQLGILGANQSKFPESLDYFYKALSNFESIKDKSKSIKIASIYQNIANIFNATEDYDKAILNYDKAIALLQKMPDKKISEAMNIASKGMIYQKQNQNQKALDELTKAETILTELKNDVPLVFVKSWIGGTLLALKKYDLSIDYSKKALITIEQMGDQDLMASTLQNLGYAYLQRGKNNNQSDDINLGFEYVNQSIAIHSTLKNQEGLSKGYLYVSEYYQLKNDYKKSLEMYQIHTAYNDSIFNFKNKQSLQNLQDQRTIELNNKQIQLNTITLENKERQKWYLIGGILLLGIIGGLLFYQSRNRQRTNEKLQLLNTELDEANKAKTRFFSILNHDLRGPVANLVFFLQLQKESPELLDEESIQRMQDKTMTGAENLLHSMEDILQWSKSQMENFKPQPQQFQIASLFEDTKKHFSSEENIDIQFENPYNLTLTTDENYLKTIVRNLTGNAVKAVTGIEKPTIIWNASQENGSTVLSITDNGKGASDEQFKALYDDKEVVGIKTGLGLHLIRDLAKAIDCEIVVHSVINEGTTFVLHIK